MKYSTKIILFGGLIVLVFLGAASVYGIHLLSVELDTKFYEVQDSVPTKVYSRVYWLRPRKLVTLEELRARFAERGYLEAAAPGPLTEGSFRIDTLPPELTRRVFDDFDFTPGLEALEQAVRAAANGEGAEAEPIKQVNEISIRLKPFTYPEAVKSLFFSSSEVGVDSEHEFTVYWFEGQVIGVARILGETQEQLDGLALEPVLVAQLSRNNTETRETLPLNEIPYTLLQAIVSVEDRRFLDHVGVDIRGILRSIYVNIRAGGYRQGASTITQQLVRNIYLTRAKTIKRKIKEMVMAVLMELRFSKDEILEKYLNEVYFGQLGNLEIHGVSQAAKYYYNKPVQQLSIAEQALLAALVRGPFYYSPTRHFERAKERQEFVLQKMLENGFITQATYKEAIAEELKFAEISNVVDRAPYFTDFIKSQLLKEIPDEELMGVGYRIFSTLDTYYQKIVEEKVKTGVDRLEQRLRKRLQAKRFKSLRDKLELEELASLQGVFILVDPKSNRLLAIVGGKSFQDSNYNRALFMRRQIGSLVKPFVYLTGLVHGANEDGTPLNSVSKLEDAPFTHRYEGQVWQPKNYEPEFQGLVTLRYALAHSINIPAAKLAIRVGLDRVVDTLNAAGVRSEIQPLPSVALGAFGVAPIDIATMYSTLANFGFRREVTAVLAITDESGEPVAQFIPNEEQVLPEPEVANVVEMMRSVFSEGTAAVARKMGFDYPARGKTGTTNNYRDSWFAGFTSQLLGVGWVGYDRDEPETSSLRRVLQLTGASGALPIWVDIMKETHKGLPNRDISPPTGVLEPFEVDLLSGGRATEDCQGENVITEYFTSRNAPQYNCPASDDL